MSRVHRFVRVARRSYGRGQWWRAGHADARRPVLLGSPLMTMVGAVSHLPWVEHCWFEVVFRSA